MRTFMHSSMTFDFLRYEYYSANFMLLVSAEIITSRQKEPLCIARVNVHLQVSCLLFIFLSAAEISAQNVAYGRYF